MGCTEDLVDLIMKVLEGIGMMHCLERKITGFLDRKVLRYFFRKDSLRGEGSVLLQTSCPTFF